MLQSVVKVKEAVACCAAVEEILDEEFSQYFIERRFCIKIENINRLFKMMQAMLYSFSKKDCCKLMRAAFSLELCWSLMLVPGSEVELSEIEIQAFGNHRASAYGSV